MARNSQCAKCGHLFDGEANPYCSEDFASYFSREPLFMMRWCFHCTHVSLYDQPWHLRLIKAENLRLKGSYSMTEIPGQPMWNAKNNDFGLFAGVHLLRMIWHCLHARALLSAKEGQAPEEAAAHLALKKLPPREAALLAYITSGGSQAVPLEQQLQEGRYLSERIFLSSLKTWIASYPDAKVSRAVLDLLSQYPENDL